MSQAGTEQIGFVGVGNQGGPMAMRIAQAGLPLTVWARRPEATAEFTAAGASAAPTMAALGSACNLVAICVRTDDDVLAVTLGEGGLIESMQPGSSLAVHSTAHPDVVRQVARAAAERDITVLDAPVSGGSTGAQAGTMAVLVGGSADVLDRWRPVFATFATSVALLGDVGAGQLAKLLNNALASVTIGASVWALQSATELGLDREGIFLALCASSGDSFMLRHAPHMDADRAHHAGSLLRKDLSLYQTLVSDTAAGSLLATTANTAIAYLESL
jgi:3-hydroxyisobutyrate dehydrogenase